MALISFAFSAKLICIFVYAYAKSRFSHDAAQIDGTKITGHLRQFGVLSGNWSHHRKTWFFACTNNKGADKPVHLSNLTSIPLFFLLLDIF